MWLFNLHGFRQLWWSRGAPWKHSTRYTKSSWLWWKYFEIQKFLCCGTLSSQVWLHVAQCRTQWGYINRIFNRTEPRRSSCFHIINSIFCSFCIPGTLKNLFEKTEMQTFSGVCLNLFMPQWKETLCVTLINIILGVFVLNNSDRKKELGCLRRQEKLTK